MCRDIEQQQKTAARVRVLLLLASKTCSRPHFLRELSNQFLLPDTSSGAGCLKFYETLEMTPCGTGSDIRTP